jgi:hypothetical protein
MGSTTDQGREYNDVSKSGVPGGHGECDRGATAVPATSVEGDSALIVDAVCAFLTYRFTREQLLQATLLALPQQRAAIIRTDLARLGEPAPGFFWQCGAVRPRQISPELTFDACSLEHEHAGHHQSFSARDTRPYEWVDGPPLCGPETAEETAARARAIRRKIIAAALPHGWQLDDRHDSKGGGQ